jgi:hypothetical protein
LRKEFAGQDRRAGLPDGLFLYQKCQFGYILEGLGMENVVILYDHLEYFEAIWYNLRPFGIHSLWSFDIFFPFWYVWTKINLATLLPGHQKRICQ